MRCTVIVLVFQRNIALFMNHCLRNVEICFENDVQQFE